MFKSGFHNRKTGDRVVKGRWKGMPIYTLTLEERRTCWDGCQHWIDCYGNKMPFVARLIAGRALEERLGREIADLTQRHPEGFVVRLHVLGDFYSVAYVRHWLSWIRRFPQLHVYGYTAWPPDTPIGALIREAADKMWSRFAVRTSCYDTPEGRNTVSADFDGRLQFWETKETRHTDRALELIRDKEAVVCPAQVDKSDCCGTCALCWQTQKTIVFIDH